MMLAPALVLAIATVVPAAATPPSIIARAQVGVFVQIIQAAEIRDGRSDTPHQRRNRRDELGRPETLLEFE